MVRLNRKNSSFCFYNGIEKFLMFDIFLENISSMTGLLLILITKFTFNVYDEIDGGYCWGKIRD